MTTPAGMPLSFSDDLCHAEMMALPDFIQNNIDWEPLNARDWHIFETLRLLDDWQSLRPMAAQAPKNVHHPVHYEMKNASPRCNMCCSSGRT
jgi:hypothetical protein